MSDETEQEMDETPEVEETESTVEPETGQAVEEDAATSDSVEQTHDDPETGQRKPGAESRIQQLVKERNQMAEYAEEMRKLASQQPQPGDDVEWEDQIADKIIQKQRMVEAQQAQQQAVKKEKEMIAERLTAARSEYPDFDQKVLGNPNLKISEVMAQAILNSDKGAAVGMRLAENPQEAARIAAIPNPIQQAMEIARLESQIPTPKTVTNAPEPVKPVNGTGGIGEKDPNEMTYSEYRAYRGFGKIT